MSKKQSNSRAVMCSVIGVFNGAACGYLQVGGKHCKLPEGTKCVYQKRIPKPKAPHAPPAPPAVVVPAPVKVKKKILEKHVEAYLYKKMKKLGGECYKWSSVNMRGVPDRICIFPPDRNCPTGIVTFVELKKDTKAKLSGGQAKFFKRMTEMRVNHCYVLHGKEEVDLWLKSMGHDI